MSSLDSRARVDVFFHPFLADGKKYPKAKVPMLPTLRLSHWFGKKSSLQKTVFSGASSFYFQGRYAMAQALKESGVGRGSIVLVPAYHCRSLVEPVIFLQAAAMFYNMTANLEPDIAHIERLLKSSERPISAMILPHFFGFLQNVLEIKKICDSNGIKLIEDCAHAFYGNIGGRSVGSFGSYSVASARKFFPTMDGGILIRNGQNQGEAPRLRCQGIDAEFRAAGKSILGLLAGYSRSKRVLDNGNVSLRSSRPVNNELTEEYDSGLKWFKPEQSDSAGLRVSQWLVRTAAHGWISARRRDNYRRWLDAVRTIPGCLPLFPELPDNVVPYVFPLVIRRLPEQVFHALKSLAVPLWRWEDMAVTDCAISNNYRYSLLQLPCHQGLSTAQLHWLIDKVVEVLRFVEQKA
jgi:dTDP-4-amino-4,6-dideoxygalactose transaminase